VRGTANIEPSPLKTALKLGRAAAHVFNPWQRTPQPWTAQDCSGQGHASPGYMLENAHPLRHPGHGRGMFSLSGVAHARGYVTRSLAADAGIVNHRIP